MTPRVRRLLLAFWIAPALVATFGLQLVPSRLRPDLTAGHAFAIQLALWLAWGAWSALVFKVADRFPLERGRVARALGVHLLLCPVVVVGQIVVAATVARAAGLAEPYGLVSTIAIGLRVHGDLFVVIYGGIVATHAALRWFALLREQELRAARLAADLADAQLRALQAKQRPHFLINALNWIVATIDRDPAAAQAMTIGLADLLRATLRVGSTQRIPLADEVDLTRRYLELERARFPDRLTVTWDLGCDPGILVPALALQPLVENAVIHGVARREGAGRIAIGATQRDREVVITVQDDGSGPAGAGDVADAGHAAYAGGVGHAAPAGDAVDVGPAGARRSADGNGIGLSNLAARLARLHGDRASVSLATVPGRGTIATLRLPVEA